MGQPAESIHLSYNDRLHVADTLTELWPDEIQPRLRSLRAHNPDVANLYADKLLNDTLARIIPEHLDHDPYWQRVVRNVTIDREPVTDIFREIGPQLRLDHIGRICIAGHLELPTNLFVQPAPKLDRLQLVFPLQ